MAKKTHAPEAAAPTVSPQVATAHIPIPPNHPLLTPVDWVNLHLPFPRVFDLEPGAKYHCKMLSDTEAQFTDPENPASTVPTFSTTPHGAVFVHKSNPFDIPSNTIISKFMLFAAARFKGDLSSAASYVQFFLMNKPVPYVRVGVDWFKTIEKENRYGGTDHVLKAWDKSTMTDDHTKSIFQLCPKYDDFIIIPDNINYVQSKKNCYNLYSKFIHTPHPDTDPVTGSATTVTDKDIPNILKLLNHIFGEQIEQGLKYFKILYETPRQILPILSLVSEPRETGKTTMLNFVEMIFGQNSVLINPEDLTHSFNSGYATKNIIIIDEGVVEKNTSVEKLKALVSAKRVSVSQKFVSAYSIPFYGKAIICSNKVKSFMRIDSEEIRFWVRVIPEISNGRDASFEDKLFKEIPMFLRYLLQLPAITNPTQSRMIFSREEIQTDALTNVKNESKSGLLKDIEILIEYYFNNEYPKLEHKGRIPANSFEADAKDIKERWFKHDTKISFSYIRSVIEDQMKLVAAKPKKYYVFHGDAITTGRPFLFVNSNPPEQEPTTHDDNDPRKTTNDELAKKYQQSAAGTQSSLTGSREDPF